MARSSWPSRAARLSASCSRAMMAMIAEASRNITRPRRTHRRTPCPPADHQDETRGELILDRLKPINQRNAAALTLIFMLHRLANGFGQRFSLEPRKTADGPVR